MTQPIRLVLAYEDHDYGFRYVIEYAWNGTFYVMYVKQRPPNPHPNVHQHTFHILDVDRICVTRGREPRTLDRAKAIAYVWMRGYSQFVATGRFPNPAHRVNVPDPRPPEDSAPGTG